MTLNGVINKTATLLLLCMLGFCYAWYQAVPAAGLIVAGGIGGLTVGLVTCFVPKAAPFLSPVYALLEGLFLGGISAVFERSFPQIAAQAAGLTFGMLVVMLALYRSRLIRVTEPLRAGIIVATGGIALLYVVCFVLSLFGTQVPYLHSTGLIGIGFSLFVVGLAALNLLLDFDFIERGVAGGAPKYLEWYAGFSLLVTLVWLYLELLRLLAKLRGRD
jgi:uncharacterized YccA/Bax inhibitor family protein